MTSQADTPKRIASVAAWHLALAVIFFLPAWIRGHVYLPGDVLCKMAPWSAAADPVGDLQNPKLTDPIEAIIPYDTLYASRLREGKLALWNPLILCGAPFYGNGQTCQAYPPRLLAYSLLPVTGAYSVLLFLHLWAAGFFFYFLLRHYDRSVLASLVGSTAWAWSAYQTLWLEWGFAAAVGAWAPLVILFYERSLRGNPLSSLCIGGLCAGLLMTSTHLGYAFGALACLIFIALIRAVEGWRSARRPAGAARPLLFVAAILLIGSAVSAVQLLPTLETTLDSHRSGMSTADHFRVRWIWLVAPIAVIHPRLLGSHTDAFDVYHFAGAHPWEMVAYAGAAPLLLAVIALFGSRDRWLRWMTLPAALTLLYIWGSPLFEVFTFLFPPLSMVTPGRFLVVGTFTLCLLAAAGVDVLREQEAGKSRRWIFRLAWLGLILLAIGSAALAAIDHPNARGVVRWYRLTNPAMLVAVASIALGFGATWWLSRRGRSAGPILTGLLAAELLVFGWQVNPTVPPKTVFPEPPSIAWLKERVADGRVWSRLTRPFWNWPMPNTFMPHEVPVIGGFEAAMPGAYTRLTNVAAGKAPGRYVRKVFLEEAPHRLLQILSVRYVVTRLDEPLDRPWLEEAYRDEVIIYRVKDPMPRAWMVHALRGASEEETCALVLSPDFDPRREAVLEGLAPGTREEIAPEGNPAVVTKVLDKGDSLFISVRTDRPGLLVVADNAARGWRATLNSKEAEILRVNGTQRGIRIPKAGEHDVMMSYQPVTLSLGFVITTAMVILIALAMVSLGIHKGLSMTTEPEPQPGQSSNDRM